MDTNLAEFEVAELVKELPAIRDYYKGCIFKTVEEDITKLCNAVESLAAQVAELTRTLAEDRQHWNDTNKDFCEADERAETAEKALAEALKERDLAVAHDRQPYPTAEAYEAVCNARTYWQQRAEAAEKLLGRHH